MVKLEAYWQLQNKETQSLSLTETSLENVMTSTQTTESVTTGTGTAGATLTGQTTGGTGTTLMFVLILFLFGVIVDRKLNQKQDLE